MNLLDVANLTQTRHGDGDVFRTRLQDRCVDGQGMDCPMARGGVRFDCAKVACTVLIPRWSKLVMIPAEAGRVG